MGYASKELTLPASLLAPLDSGTIVGPNLLIEFKEPAQIARLSPIVDVSTFSAVDPLPDSPADGLVVRSHLRSDPLLGFSLDGLPTGVVINRAVLTVTLDSTRSYGPAEAIVCCETPASNFPPDSVSYLLDDLPSRLTAAAGVVGIETYAKRRVRFDLTSTVQRWANGVYGEPLLFALLPAEDFLTAYNSNSLGSGRFLAALLVLRHRGRRSERPAPAAHPLHAASRHGGEATVMRRPTVVGARGGVPGPASRRRSAVPARAQSPFSLVHLGAPAAGGDARVLGRGGWGLAESDTLAPSFLNPAGLPGLRQVAIALSGYGESHPQSGARPAAATMRGS